MLSAAVRVLARSAAIQLEEVAAAHALSEASIRKGKSRAAGERIGTDGPSTSTSTTIRDEALAHSPLDAVGDASMTKLPSSLRDPGTVQGSPWQKPVQPVKTAEKLPESVLQPETVQGSTSRATVTEAPGVAPTSATASPLPTAESVSIPAAGLASLPSSTLVDDPPLVVTDAPEPIPEGVTPVAALPELETLAQAEDDDVPVVLRASRVPSSRIGRLFHYGSLAASLSFGAASESLRRTTKGGGQGSVFMSDANVRRLVATLGRMRGAALKLGQFMSIQDNHMLPAEIEKVLQQVQAHANYMPDWQMEKMMREELGSDWQSLFSEFERVPVASASIGQVHRGVLASDGTPVAVKIQFPGVASSINSDLSNLSILIRSSALLPKGLYLQNTIAVMRRELEDECDYVREAESGKKFEKFLADDPFFVVPRVIDEATTGKVLTTEWASGKPLSKMKGMSQETRDKIGENILRLCLQELFEFRLMQTDPNWANFLYDSAEDKVQLIDFGASREYTKEFMDGWFRLLQAGLDGDRDIMKLESEKLGYLTGEENEEMLKAHLDSMALVVSPFAFKGKYPFATQTITDSVRELIPVMLRHRLTPPPQETYSLNRKLSGAFLMCAKLQANVDCHKLWQEHVSGYQQG